MSNSEKSDAKAIFEAYQKEVANVCIRCGRKVRMSWYFTVPFQLLVDQRLGHLLGDILFEKHKKTICKKCLKELTKELEPMWKNLKKEVEAWLTSQSAGFVFE